MSLSVEHGIGSEEQLTGRTGAAAPVKNDANGNGAGAPAPALAPGRPWSIAEAAKLYGIQSWGQGYFSINPEGNVAAHPTQDPNLSIDLKKLVDELTLNRGPPGREGARPERGARGHAVQPGAEGITHPERAGLADEHQERGLERVVRVVLVAQDPLASAEDHRPVALHEHRERTL